MVKVAIIGRSGIMGQFIEAACIEKKYHVVGGVSKKENIFDTKIEFDILIDFSLPIVLEEHFEKILESGKPYITGVTGLSDSQYDLLIQLSRKIPVLHSSNFSIGLNLLNNALGHIASKIPINSIIDIVETHHTRKKDIPSGTAKTLAETIIHQNNFKNKYQMNLKNRYTDYDSIRIKSIREGDVVGEHIIKIQLDEEIIELKHHAQNRKIFAAGAVSFVEKILKCPNGLYNINDLI